MTELTVRQPRQMLTAWAAEQDAVGSRRGEVVRAALAGGFRRVKVIFRDALIASMRLVRQPVRRPCARFGRAG